MNRKINIDPLLMVLAFLFIHAIVNGILDNIDHHKGSQTLRDVWHLVKHLDRLTLIIFGGLLFSVRNWDGYHVVILLLAIVLAKILWNYFYTSHVDFWINLDNTVQFPSLGHFLDHLLGFQH